MNFKFLLLVVPAILLLNTVEGAKKAGKNGRFLEITQKDREAYVEYHNNARRKVSFFKYLYFFFYSTNYYKN